MIMYSVVKFSQWIFLNVYIKAIGMSYHSISISHDKSVGSVETYNNRKIECYTHQKKKKKKEKKRKKSLLSLKKKKKKKNTYTSPKTNCDFLL